MVTSVLTHASEIWMMSMKERITAHTNVEMEFLRRVNDRRIRNEKCNEDISAVSSVKL